MTRRLLARLAMLGALVPAPARAAFEFDAFDPAAAARGDSGPAWPVSDRPACGSLPLSGSAGGPGVLFSAVRFSAAPELSGSAALAWSRLGPGIMVIEALRLSLPPYAETTLRLTAGRPRASGWSWALSGALEDWSAGAFGERRFRIGGGLGYAPRTDLRLGVAAGPDGALDSGVTLDPIPGFRVGAGYRTIRNGSLGRLRTGVEVRAAESAILRVGFAPDTGITSLGAGFRVRGIRIDVARRDHPRLGASVHFGAAFAGGRGSQ